MSALKKGKLLELRLMSNMESHVKVYLRNYKQMHSFIVTNKKEHFYIIRSMHRDCNYPQTPTNAHKSQILHIHQLSFMFQQ